MTNRCPTRYDERINRGLNDSRLAQRSTRHTHASRRPTEKRLSLRWAWRPPYLCRDFGIGEDEYGTDKTLPEFAAKELEPRGFQCTFIHADSKDPNHFPGLQALQQADLLFLSVRRRTPPDADLALIRRFLAEGKPLVAIRTSSHPFSIRKGDPPAGQGQWPKFDQEVLGSRYEGHYPNKDGTPISTLPRAEEHPILAGVKPTTFYSCGTLYKMLDLGPQTLPLLRGIATDKGQPVSHPVAWTNTAGKSPVFYTSLGHPVDFQQESFRKILTNSVYWTLQRSPPAEIAAVQSTKN